MEGYLYLRFFLVRGRLSPFLLTGTLIMYMSTCEANNLPLIELSNKEPLFYPGKVIVFSIFTTIYLKSNYDNGNVLVVILKSY